MINLSLNNFHSVNNSNNIYKPLYTDYSAMQSEISNIFSPMNTNNMSILELSSLKTNINSPLRVKVKKLNAEYNVNINAQDLKKKTLVLDLDETLVHSSTKAPFPNKKNIVLNMTINDIKHKIYVIVRPFLELFLREMSLCYNLFIFTASLAQYSTNLVNILDKNKVILKVLNREHCQFKGGFYFKNLIIFNRDYKDIIILDNNPISYALNKSNGIPIPTWIDDPNDKELLKLIPILKYISKLNDVRPFINKIVNSSTQKLDYVKAYKLLNNDNNLQNKQTYNRNNLIHNFKTFNKVFTNNLNKENKIKKNVTITDTDKCTTKNKILNILNNGKKMTNINKNNINKGNINNINNQNIIKKLKLKNLKYQKKLEVEKEKIPTDKKNKKEVKPQQNIYNISIKNINNSQNNINILNNTTNINKNFNKNYKSSATSTLQNQLKPKMKIIKKFRMKKNANKNNNNNLTQNNSKMNKSVKIRGIKKIEYTLDENIEKEWKSKYFAKDIYPSDNFRLNTMNNLTLTLKDITDNDTKKPLDDIEQEKEKQNLYLSNLFSLSKKEVSEPILINLNKEEKKSFQKQKLLRNSETFHPLIKNKIVVMKIIKNKSPKSRDDKISNSHTYNNFDTRYKNNIPNYFGNFMYQNRYTFNKEEY